MDRTYLITMRNFDGVERIRAASRRQAQYRLWLHAVDAGYRVTLIQFVREWIKSIRLDRPAA